MSIHTSIKLNDTITPSIPFLWYREEELTCPIEHITYHDNIYTIIQTHIFKDSNIYICLHSLLYYTLHKINTPIINIPPNYAINKFFTVTVNGPIIKSPNSLQNNIPANGPVHIHDGAYSPTGFPCFKVDTTKDMNEILCNVKCDELNIDMNCKFVLFNEINGKNMNDKIKLYMNSHKQITQLSES